MKRKLIILGIIGMFLITGLASVASADSWYIGWVCNITAYESEGGEYYYHGLSIAGVIDDDQGHRHPYIFKNVDLRSIMVFQNWIRLYILMKSNHLNMPLFIQGVIVE